MFLIIRKIYLFLFRTHVNIKIRTKIPAERGGKKEGENDSVCTKLTSFGFETYSGHERNTFGTKAKRSENGEKASGE